MPRTSSPQPSPTPSPQRALQAWVLPLVLLLVTGALLGLSANLAKIASEVGLSPLAFLTWSVIGATVVLTVTGAARRRLPKLNARTVEYLLVSGLVSVAAPNLLFFAAVPEIGAGFVALAISFPPLLTYLGTIFLGMERFRAICGAGVAFALGGAAVLAFFKLSGPDSAPFWVIATLCGPVILAAGNIYRTARWPAGALPDALAPGMLAASGIMLLTTGLLASLLPGSLDSPGGFSLAVPTLSAAPALLILAQSAAFSLQYLLFFILQKRGGPVYLSLLGSVGALVGVPIAVLLLGEAIPQGLAAGGALIVLGIGLLTFGRTRS